MTIRRKQVWIVISKRRELINWHCMTDGEEGLEVHRTKRLATRSHGLRLCPLSPAKMIQFGVKRAGEKVVKATLTWKA